MFRLNPFVNPQVQNTSICIINIIFLAILKFYFKRTLRSSDPCSQTFPFHLTENKYTWESESHSVVSDSLRPHGLYSPWNSPSQNTGVGSLSLLQGTFPTQQLKPDLPHWRWILYQLSYKGSPRILEWVAYPFSSGSSQGVEPGSLALQMVSFPTELWAKPIYLRTCWHSWLCSTHSPHLLQPHQNKT